MDITTFYALFSATCFTLLGLWWNVLQLNSQWIDVPDERKAVGGVYLTFLLPAAMGLFAQVGGAETPVIWRISFVGVAVVGCVSTLRLLRVLRSSEAKGPQTKYFATLLIYVLVAVIGAAPEVAGPLGIKPIQAEAHPADPAGARRSRAGLGLHGAPAAGRDARARLRRVTPERLAVLARVADGLPDLDRPVLVVVDGADGAGKTWFADDLAALLEESGRPVVRATVDDFHHPRAHRHELGRTGETVWTRSFDYRALRHHLLDPWGSGAGATYRRRHHDLAADALVDEPAAEVPEHGVLVVDGVFAQRAELAGCWDLVVWLDVPDEERVRRMAGATAYLPTPRIPTSSGTSTPRRSTVLPPTRSVAPTWSWTTPTRRGRSWSVRRPRLPAGTGRRTACGGW